MGKMRACDAQLGGARIDAAEGAARKSPWRNASERDSRRSAWGRKRVPVIKGGGFLRWADFQWPENRDEFPLNVPAFRELERLEFHPAVTFFIGENGTGKSTLLEAIAVKAGFSAEGGWKRRATEEISASSGLDHHVRLARGGYPGDGWFLRAESFYNVATELERLDKEPFCGHGFAAYGGKELHAQSHGEPVCTPGDFAAAAARYRRTVTRSRPSSRAILRFEQPRSYRAKMLY